MNSRPTTGREPDKGFAEIAALIDASPVLIWASGPDKRCNYFNKTWLDFAGRTMEQEWGDGWVDRVHADDHTRRLEIYYESFEARQPFKVEYRLRRHDGPYCWMLDTGVPRYDPDGSFAGYIGSCFDITEKRQAEDLLRLQSVALNAAANSMVITDSNGVIQWVNEAFAKATGYTANEAIGQKPSLLKSGQQSPEFYKKMWDTVLSGQIWHGQLRNKRKDGTLYDEEIAITPLRNPQGAITHFIAVKTDITERERIHNSLRESEAHNRSIIESSLDAIITMDADGLITTWSPQAELVFGWSRNEAVGRRLSETIVPPAFRERHEAGLKALRDGGSPHINSRVLEFIAIDRQGREFSIELSIVPVNLGNTRQYSAFVRDITERKRAELELLTTNARLERATVRANELARQAESANDAKSEFLANMSHEIRTPMNGVLGMIGLLLDTDLTAVQRRYARTVRSSGNSLLSLINNILDFSKIEAGKVELENLDFDLFRFVDNLTLTMAAQAHEKGLVLACVVAPEVPSAVVGDPGRLRQILTNFVGNAIKFTAKGAVVIRVTVVSETPDAAQIRFAVRDTGLGIPTDKMGKLFNKFSQVDSSTTRTYGGTGLGLAIAKQLTQLMGGEIGLQSEEGKGSEFWFTVQLTKSRAAVPAVESAPDNLYGRRVLIVDDTPVNREILMVLLKSWGLRPAEAVDGPTALLALTQAQAAGDPFVIAILDMHMPMMNGETLGGLIKNDPKLQETQLMMCSSLGHSNHIETWQAIGFVASLTKPVQRQELREALKKAISGMKTVSSLSNSPFGFAVGNSLMRSNILVVEDNITNQQVAQGILEKLGQKVSVVTNGIEAVHALETVSYDLVLMDLQMPAMDGFEATRCIRDPQSSVLSHHVPIIAMTAHAFQRDREICLQAGMDDYLTKPIEVAALIAILEKWSKPRNDGWQPIGSEAGGKVSAATHEGDIPVFDRAALMNRLLNDEDLARVVVDGFFKDLPDQIIQLKTYAAAGDALRAEQQAHKIKGACATVGGAALSALAALLEQAGRDENLSLIIAQMPELDRQFRELKETMENEIS